MRIQAIDDWKAMACLFDQPSTSRVVKVLQLLPADFWVLICSFLPINDWGNLEFVSKRMNMVMKTVWKSKRSAILDADLVALARLIPDASSSSMSRFSLPPDNLWTHLRSEVDFLLPREVLMLAYPDLGYWAKKCSHVQSITFLEAPYKSHRVPVGRSFFRFLAIGVFDSLTVLDLTMTSFELADFEHCDQTFPDLQHLIVDRCCIYMYRRDILTTKPENELRSTMIDYAKQRKKMRAGTKLFLATVIDCYRQLRHVSASSTEYRSNGCITFGYGEEEKDAVYEFAPRMRRSSYCAALLKRAVAQFNNRVNNNVEQRV